jgi:methionyl-tRNA formyltransferase
MKPVSILFLGCQKPYSQLVKQALAKAGYVVVNNLNQAQLIIVAAYGHKIPLTTINSVELGGLNLHPSLLPKYRGATPVAHALLNQEKQTGITIFKMTQKVDAGPILAQQAIPISPQDTTETLLNKCFKLGAKMLISLLPDYIEGNLSSKPQPKKSPTPYCKKFTKQDGYIPWQKFVKSLEIRNLQLEIERATRAFYPWPGLWTKMPACAGRPNGKILKLLPQNRVQIEGKSPISWQQFLAGYKHLLK